MVTKEYSGNWVKVVGSATTQYLSAAGPQAAASAAQFQEEQAMFAAGVRLAEGWRRSPPRPRPTSPIRSEDEAWWSSWAPVVATKKTPAATAGATAVAAEAAAGLEPVAAKEAAAGSAPAAAQAVVSDSEDEAWGNWRAKSEPSEGSVDWDDI